MEKERTKGKLEKQIRKNWKQERKIGHIIKHHYSKENDNHPFFDT